MTKRPNFFIVGAPKSGTTALYSYLKVHPQVFFPHRKEIHYFCSDLSYRTPPISQNEYLSYYKKADNHKIVGDASVFYLLSKKAAPLINEFSPDAKIVIMLRSPADMVYSFYSQLLANGDETIANFEQALQAETERKKGNMIGTSPYRKCPLEAFYYSDVAKYYEQTKRYSDIFGSRVHIILYDDFKNSTEEEYFKVLDFLEIERIKQDKFEVVNPNKTVRSQNVQKLLMNPPAILKKLVRVILPEHSKRKQWVMDKLWESNLKQEQRQEMKPETRKHLISVYKEDIEKLALLLNRDLSMWLT
jgi:hypothetical protein